MTLAATLPLIVLLLGFFALGIVLGVMACLVRVVQQRRELAALRRELAAASRASAAPASPSPAPSELGL